MVYTSFELLSRAGNLVEGTILVLAAVFAVAYGLAVWGAPRHQA
jgi:hypothetical protein